MPHSLTKIWIHAVWSTKDVQPLIKSSFSNDLYEHFQKQFYEMKCYSDVINGIPNHIHILFRLSHNKSIAEVIKAVKGESSRWINQQKFLVAKFAWQVGYAAFSVSESGKNSVKKYIANQQERHRKMTFHEEYQLLLKKHNLLNINH